MMVRRMRAFVMVTKMGYGGVSVVTARRQACSPFAATTTTFFRRKECDRSDKHHPSGSDPRFGQRDGSPTIFREWETPRRLSPPFPEHPSVRHTLRLPHARFWN